MFAVLKKELKSYLLTPIGYIFIGLFLLMFGILFFGAVYSYRDSHFEYAFYDAATIITFLIPVLTMRMFAEERKSGTEQLLLTSPKSITQVVIGKFLAGVIIVLLSTLGTLVHFAILKHFTTPDIKVALVTMFGFVLLCCCYLSFGMFISSVSENQIVASVLTIACFIGMWFIPNIWEGFLNISLMNMYEHFPMGVIDLAEIVKFVTFAIFFIILTIIVLKRRKCVK